MNSIQSLNLYVLKDVHIEQLRTGESAPDLLPLTIMQAKVYCDEELSVFLDVEEDFDHVDEKRFFKVLANEPKFVDQLFSTQRAILCYAVRRRDKDYGDPWSNNERNKLNRKVGLMVRDGENLYVVNSPIHSHLRANNLFPGRGGTGRHLRQAQGRKMTVSFAGMDVDDVNAD